MIAVPDERTVYAFLSLEQGVELSRVAPYKATREAIERRFGGCLLEGTAQVVDPDELDEFGRYVRRPTGWGELSA